MSHMKTYASGIEYKIKISPHTKNEIFFHFASLVVAARVKRVYEIDYYSL